MTADRPNRAETGLPGAPPRPSVEEVVSRLDNLWSSSGGDSPGPLLDFSGQRVGAYRLEQPIGCGAFGVVYRARDENLARDVALKIPRPDVLLDPEKLRRFENEAALAAALDHPSIVRVYMAELSGPTPFIASAYCVGPDLGAWLANHSDPLPPREAARLMIKVAEAVEYAHGQGVVHRDLKPSNILLEPKRGDEPRTLDDFDPKLTDFGLAKLVQESLQDTRSSLLIGTPLYMAPEQLLPGTQDADGAADVYALGVLLFELLTLRTPFGGANYIEVVDRLRQEEAPLLKSVRPEAPSELQAICAKCLQKDPSDRYATAQGVADELRRFVADEPIETKAHFALDRWRRWSRRPERLVAAGRFTLYYQLFIVIWMFAVFAAGWASDAAPAAILRASLIDILTVAFAFHLPKIGLALALMRERRWAYWPSAISSLILLAIFVYSLGSDGVAFSYNYPTLVSKLNTFAALIMGSLCEVLLHAVALPAWRRGRVVERPT